MPTNEEHESENRVSIYVGVGIDTYDQMDAFPALQNAVAEVRDVSGILSGYGYAAHVFEDPDDLSVFGKLRDLLRPDIVSRGGSLVILWSGHGESTKNGGLNLVARNTKSGTAAVLTPAYLADLAARTGASQILLILDTCFSGGGVIAATTVADAILQELPPDAKRIWLGVVASSLDLQRARDGAFGALLVKLLRSGPDDDELKKRWSAHSAGVRGDDLIDALEKEWSLPDQSLKTIGSGNAWVMLPNPIYKPAPPERMDAHLLRAARGGEPDDERSYFTGRVAEINRVVAWMSAAQPGTFVVTGSPGSGKSAIIGRIVSLSDREERARLLAQEPLEHDDPGEGSVHAHVHALRYTAERLVTAIDEQLVRGGFLLPDANGRRNRGELLGAIQRSPRRPVIAIDGLNESGAESWRMAEDVLRLLSEVALVLVGTQNLPPAEGPLSLIQAVGAKVVVDLDDPALRDETEKDLRRYAEKRLANAAGASMDVGKVASMMLEFSRAQDAGAFLLAQVITTQLRGMPVDTSRRTWKKALASSIEQRVERFVGNAPPLNRSDLALPQAAKELLEALAWAKGPGMPDDIWPVAATALSATATTYERSDVFWLLGRTERYVLEDGQGGRAVYRLVHQWLLEHLRPQSAAASNEPLTIDAPAVRLARALVDYYLELLRAGQAPQTHAYLWRYTWQHCADAGELGIEAFRPLVEQNTKAFSLDLALGLSALSRQHVRLGHPHDAVKAASETVAIYRELAKGDPAMVTELAAALVALGSLHSMTGQWEDALTAHTEAVELFKTMAPSNPAVRVPMASAFSGLGLSYFLKGEWSKGLAAAGEALALLKEPGSDNPAFVADLAVALTVLGLGYSQTGAPEKARAAASEAVDLFRTMDTSNPAVLPMFMWALTTLAIGRAQTGQPIEARDTAKEAVDLASRMDLDNPAVRPASAMALTILGQSYAQTGQPAESLSAARQAVDLLATMDAANPAIGLMLGSALLILGTGYFQTGQPGESLAPAGQAVDLFRAMDDANPLVLQSLASALTVLGLAYAQTGQPLKAHDAADEAVTLIRKTDTDNPVVAQGLAWALSALGLSDVLIGQPQESLSATTEAVELFKKLDTANPAVARIYGLTLANHALASLQTGQLEQAREAGEEAVRLLTLADPRNLLVQPVAWALTVLSQSYLQLGETQKAQDAVRRAVDLFEKTDIANPAIALMFAEALTALSQADLAGTQAEDARDASNKAVQVLESLDQANSSIAITIGRARAQAGLSEAAAGDLAKALDADTKAIDTFQSLVASSPFGLVLLGEALAQFGDHCRQSGRAADADARWKAVVDSRPEPRAKVSLLLRLAGWREAADLAAVSDLIQAASFLSDADRDLRAELHQLARSIRANNPTGFDAAWRAGEGDVPPWLTLDPSVVSGIVNWIRQESPAAGRAFLEQHLASWPPDADAVAFDDLALQLDDPSALAPQRALLQSARTVGIDAAYRPSLAMQLLQEWISADNESSRAMLQSRRDELLGEPVATAMRVLLEQDPNDPALVANQAFLELARAGRDELAFQAAENPAQVSPALLDLALTGEADVLDALSTLITVAADTDAGRAPVYFYKAMALALRDRPEDAATAVAHARTLDATQLPAWLAQIVRLVGKYPQLIPLSQALIAQPAASARGGE